MANGDKYGSTETVTEDKVLIKKPKLYKVILLNDDYTPMEYVVQLLKVVFRKNENGSGVCGIFTKEIAETKVETVLKMAKSDQHPLKCIMEPD